ncbi:Hpt domain-containing protein [Microcoleus sp. FACHB-53]|nr:Hpt domain-containing protein [Microcoleus sp. FACHB-53]
MQPEQQQQFIEDFGGRAKDHLYTMEQCLLNLQKTKEIEVVYQILRAIHSINEGAAVVGLSSINQTAHRFQKNLEALRDYPVEFDQKLESLFLQIVDALYLLVNKLEEPFGLTENEASKIISDTEPVFQALKAHLDLLINPQVPFAEIEQIFPLKSAVQNAADEYSKQAEVIIDGRETLIPESILKQLPRLLTHLVNNAIAHGIELPEARQAAGKSPVGQIVLRAFRQGNKIVISFTDDGAGIDVERVKAKAIEKELIKIDEAQSLSTIQVYELLYCPDFSTKDERDLRAGLGFGLDVIRTELTKLGGVISTDSKSGKGTNFTIVYPEKII